MKTSPPHPHLSMKKAMIMTSNRAHLCLFMLVFMGNVVHNLYPQGLNTKEGSCITNAEEVSSWYTHSYYFTLLAAFCLQIFADVFLLEQQLRTTFPTWAGMRRRRCAQLDDHHKTWESSLCGRRCPCIRCSASVRRLYELWRLTEPFLTKCVTEYLGPVVRETGSELKVDDGWLSVATAKIKKTSFPLNRTWIII